MIRWLIAPRTQVGFHTIGFVLFIVFMLPSLTIWKDSLLWVIVLSVYAIIVSHWTRIVAALAMLYSAQTNETCSSCGEVNE